MTSGFYRVSLRFPCAASLVGDMAGPVRFAGESLPRSCRRPAQRTLSGCRWRAHCCIIPTDMDAGIRFPDGGPAGCVRRTALPRLPGSSSARAPLIVQDLMKTSGLGSIRAREISFQLRSGVSACNSPDSASWRIRERVSAATRKPGRRSGRRGALRAGPAVDLRRTPGNVAQQARLEVGLAAVGGSYPPVRPRPWR